MSEERLERIENQLDRVVNVIDVMQQNITVLQHSMVALQQSMTVVQQNMTVVQENMTALQQRVDSMEGTLLTAMTDGFNSLQRYISDVDIDLVQNERKTEDNARKSRRLNQRLMRLEQRYYGDDF
jgi:chromosome segregation ATPase